ncbi:MULTISPECIES: GDSL-type esterase/lipase family protein [unclassified Paenibacillus]|uniref:GDSL-type esterase/lipase family protein n=1 Tax=unclassified Paenibacillus TaxID=185978 RepID=UPI001045D871|nr:MULTISPECIES: GDSL-type esterase/lipase family protein [unclassified Paenibacillus]NIK71903.1 lysophospholipase L1-like esterase [Paenibacillus sp. BK720]TCM96550.1 lysophospholipase L1-like esterase [Paenibacillus sp. BK033]
MRTISSRNLWMIIGISAVLSTLLLVAGFGLAVKDLLYPKGQTFAGNADMPALPAGGKLSESKDIAITAIGDSLTKGTGDASGEGYVKQVVALLKQNHPGVSVRLNNNLAINGLKTKQLEQLLKTDKSYSFALKQANVIVFTIGGNDLFQTASSPGKAAGEMNLDKLKADLPQSLNRLAQIVKRLHAINPDARVVYVGLYNPFYDIPEFRDGSLHIQQWNERTYALLHRYPNMSMVPTFDLFENAIGRYLSSDHFHPNHDGYAQIAARIVQSLE